MIQTSLDGNPPHTIDFSRSLPVLISILDACCGEFPTAAWCSMRVSRLASAHDIFISTLKQCYVSVRDWNFIMAKSSVGILTVVLESTGWACTTDMEQRPFGLVLVIGVSVIFCDVTAGEPIRLKIGMYQCTNSSLKDSRKEVLKN